MSNPTTSSMEVDENVLRDRDLEIEKILQIVEIILNEMGKTESDKIHKEIGEGKIDLDVSDEVARFLMTVFTCLRKEEIEKKGHNRFLGYSAKINNIEVTVKSVVEHVKAKGISLNFLIATPIIEIMTLFRSFFDEVRTGLTRFRVRDSVAKKGVKRDRSGKAIAVNKRQANSQNISQYGLTNRHIALLQGITLAPERRAGVLRSLGPMTQALLLVMEDKNFDKLKSALSTSLQMLPMSSEIITALKEASHPGGVSGVLKELGDILLLTTPRSTQKIYFPLLLFIFLWRQKGKVAWSFSGCAVIKYYTDMCNKCKIQFIMKSGADAFKTSEVIFHAMFGTYLENLNILEQITNKPKWHIRKELNSVFIKRSEKSQVTFQPIRFKYVSKMAQPLLTKSLGNVNPMSIARPSFTGFRKRHFTQEFLTYCTGKSALNFTSKPTQLQYALKKLKDELMSEKDKLLHSGKNKWETIGNDGNWVKCDFEPEVGNSFFYGN